MKKFYYLIFALLTLLPCTSGFSQDARIKSEISPSRDANGSRFAVEATVMEDDNWCFVGWPQASYPWEMAYDDGEADDYFIYQNSGNMNGNRFTPMGYPVIITGGRIYVGDGSFPGPFLGTSFRVIVYDDDGEGGLPGTALDSMDVTVNNYGWVEFEGMTATIEDGDFYLAMKQMAPSPDAAPVGVDLDNPTYNISYSYFAGNPGWITCPLQDLMIRAWINGYYEPSRDIDYFQIARFANFDPDGSPLLGDTTVLNTEVYESYYEDYDWAGLSPGYYAYGVKTHFTSGEWSDYDVSNIVPHALNSFPPLCFYQADTGDMPMIVCPPLDSAGSVPFNLLGYNLFHEGEFLALLPPETTAVQPMEYLPDSLDPGTFHFSLSALYDLTPFGYPDETLESEQVISDYIYRFGLPLEFLETWSAGNFENNNWTAEGTNWTVTNGYGHPSPAAEFIGYPIQNSYVYNLESYPFLADNLQAGELWLDFDLKLQSILPTGKEFLKVEIWNWQSQVWTKAITYWNRESSFEWTPEHLDITSFAMNQVFKIRFSAQGENSENIDAWYIDNISVYRACIAPAYLEANGLVSGGIQLNWEAPDFNRYIHWDDGEFSGTSIGNGNSTEFDAAVRWIPRQLGGYNGDTLVQVSFVPAEAQATYHIKVWIGPGAASCILDQEVVAPVIRQWNYITMLYPIIIDSTQELWVGYNVDTPTGYPAGVDNGPAVDGYGNMIDFGGWQTLLQINSDLNYNWNIQAYIHKKMEPGQLKYAVYRSDDYGSYFLRDYSEQNQYFDDSVCQMPPSSHGYKVTAIVMKGNDSCESDYAGPSWEICTGMNDFAYEPDLRIYPNPANDLLFIDSPGKIESIIIYNGRGEKVMSIAGNGKKMSVPVDGLAPGLYVVRIDMGYELIMRKIIIW
jgi:hypothetical protein